MFIASQLIVFGIGCAAVFLLLMTVQPSSPEQSEPQPPTASRSLLSLIIFGCFVVILLNFLEHQLVDDAVNAQNLVRAQALGTLQNHVNQLGVVLSEADAHRRNSKEFLEDQELIQRNTLTQLATAVTKLRSGNPTGPPGAMRSPAVAMSPGLAAAPVPAARPTTPPIIPRNANEKRLLDEIRVLEQERDQLVAQQETYRRNYEANRINEKDSERALQLAKTFSDYSAYMEQRIMTQNNKIARRMQELRPQP
ncbi:MAG: hypothetical protein ACI8W8_002682 [Rhodothermales bacterium]|jgi:hypothetical protein